MSSLRRVVAAVFAAVCSLPAGAEIRVVADAPLTGPDRYPIAAAVDPVARKAFVAIGGSTPAIVAMDLDTLATRRIALGGWPQVVVADAAHKRVYVLAQADPIEWGDSYVAAIDTESEAVRGVLAVGGFTWDMDADLARRELYVSGERTLLVVDAESLKLKSAIGLGIQPAGVAVDRARRTIVAGNDRARASRIALVDARTRTVIALPEVFDRGDSDWQHGAAWPVVDERTGYFYVQHGEGRVSALGPPAYDVTVEFDPTDATYSESQSAYSSASSHLFQVGYGYGCGPGGCTRARPSTAALRAVDATAATVTIAPLPADAGIESRTLIVDDDGGDVYVSLGPPSHSLLRIDPQSLAVREALMIPDLVAELAFRDPATRRLYLIGDDRVVVVDTRGAKAGTRIAHGYRREAFDHYFVTADPVESRLVDDGRHGSDWVPGEDLFRVWTEPVADSVPVCRFFSARFAPQSSHVYAAHAAECEGLRRGGDWQYEGVAFHVALPDVTGACPAGTEPLYRLYNEGAGGAPNHRYTASPQVVAAMAARGWSAEGVGTDRVFACTPALR